ncbi:L,D-transpeptidase-like protein [Serpentinicella alkaliphila]|uniref:L,D-transpeptidase-like protein n=2 Tax=Serpentinicella alkaliphila TaxID=1734049 RepID=A0A4R2TG86_9FIRM|nr:L,D-transpeptidase-like protein [Serpentinicella alkaliphila]
MGLTATGGSYGIHGTNNPNSIGHAASAGCVRMYNHDVIELYNTVPIGTIVNIYFNLEIALISYLILRLFLYVLELKFSYIFL